MTKKKVLATIGTIGLTAALAIGGTLAYIGNITETKKNEFSNDNSIIPKLEEIFNEDEARNYTPGTPVVKIPTVTNSSQNNSQMVAGMVLKYTWKENKDSEALTKWNDIKEYADIAWTNAGWENIGTDANGIEVYRYDGYLNAGDTTDPIFNAVTIKQDIMKMLIQKNYTKLAGEDGLLYKIDPNGKDIEGAITVTESSTDKKDADGNLVTTKITTVYVPVTSENIDSTTKYYSHSVKEQKDVFTEITYPEYPSFDIEVTGLGVQTMNDTTAENAALLDLAANAGYVAK